MSDCQPTKKNVVSLTARFFDPLRVMSPVTINLKIFFQQLCKKKVNWDEPLTGALLKQWEHFKSSLNEPSSVQIPRCYFQDMPNSSMTSSLIGFCDASVKAYAAVIYLKLQSDTHMSIKFLSAKTRVAPLTKFTIPRLELLSALLLSKLIVTVTDALTDELVLTEPTCYTDSKVTLYWIQGSSQEWKQFVENRVKTIRTAIPAQHWKHCPGNTNPADLPSRGTTASELVHNQLWLNEPDWLYRTQEHQEECQTDLTIPEECLTEMKRSQASSHSLICLQCSPTRIGNLINCARFSSLDRLMRVTALVLDFTHILRKRIKGNEEASSETEQPVSHFEQAKLLWLQDNQYEFRNETETKFTLWKCQLDLFLDDHGLWRCGGRLQQSDLSLSAKHPVLLDGRHHVTTLIIRDAHHRVMHNGVKETLTELRSNFWLVRGRQIIRKFIHRCLICRRLEGKSPEGVPPPALPDFRVRQSRPFEHTGLDFAGPFYVKGLEDPKVWLCLCTCGVTRAVHLELVPDLNATTFIRSVKRFTS